MADLELAEHRLLEATHPVLVVGPVGHVHPQDVEDEEEGEGDDGDSDGDGDHLDSLLSVVVMIVVM